jgi:hypothetical protein
VKVPACQQAVTSKREYQTTANNILGAPSVAHALFRLGGRAVDADSSSGEGKREKKLLKKLEKLAVRMGLNGDDDPSGGVYVRTLAARR